MRIRQRFLGLAQLEPEPGRLIDFITFFHANQLAIPATAKLTHPSHHRASASNIVLARHGPTTALAAFHVLDGLHFESMTVSNNFHNTWNFSFQSTNLFHDVTPMTNNKFSMINSQSKSRNINTLRRQQDLPKK